MAHKNDAFVLTQSHLHEGLTGEDMTAYAGIPVVVARHDDFPHSEELRKNGYLNGHKLNERSLAVARYMKEVKFSELLVNAGSIAEGGSAFTYFKRQHTDILRLQTDAFGAWNPHEINRRYFLPATQAQAETPDRWVVVPKPFGVSIGEYLSQPIRAVKAIVIVDPLNESPEKLWSLYTGLPAARITNAPDTQVERLEGCLHEMRHLIQVSDGPSNYYKEIDADLFARSVLRDQLPLLGVDPEKHLQENLSTHYAKLLITSGSHQIASALEAFEARKKPPDIKAALDEICGRISEKETGKYPAVQQDGKFFRRCDGEPQVVYSLLRRCTEDGGLSHNPLAAHIAHKILEAVEYFSEGLTRTPAIVNKIYPVPGL